MPCCSAHPKRHALTGEDAPDQDDSDDNNAEQVLNAELRSIEAVEEAIANEVSWGYPSLSGIFRKIIEGAGNRIQDRLLTAFLIRRRCLLQTSCRSSMYDALGFRCPAKLALRELLVCPCPNPHIVAYAPPLPSPYPLSNGLKKDVL